MELRIRAVMSSPVISIESRTTLPEIRTILQTHNIRRVPVVDSNRLVGIVTLGDVRNAFASDATTLSVYELTYLLDNITAGTIMRTNLITVSSDTTIVEAARLMLEHKISGLPVVDEGRLVGMITESDIFRAVIAGGVAVASHYAATMPACTIKPRLVV